MLVEGGEWRLGTLTEGSDHDYQLMHTESGLRIPFDYAVVDGSISLWISGQPGPTFPDCNRLPDVIVRRLEQIADE